MIQREAQGRARETAVRGFRAMWRHSYVSLVRQPTIYLGTYNENCMSEINQSATAITISLNFSTKAAN